ncbi:SARP family transcriptional regulator [Streptomyces mashuensis]|uniref:SARP family transcriptional regulator n=1 Tax=Streptomyces mashuensis TaxID=33904 RepID=A0A919B873_9ACTN|nr:AfsR/SARP family transcriptional regulator [Streptomyces mashuensis]GHF65430.1 SARP family transcriptional regulator [Streptomyces mashuensis]
MHVRVLGEFEVRRAGADLTPSAPKLRQVFALLAVEANRAVRTDQLIEELWEDRPPLSAVTTLQTYIYQLRKLLGWPATTGPDVGTGTRQVALRTTPGGYVLDLPEGALDAVEFEDLAVLGRSQLMKGCFEEAAGTLRQALELWNGRAFGAISPGPLLHAQLVRLEELRKLALDHRIEADLRLGRHMDLIGELSTLTAQQPTHEGFQAKLMLSLYRAGRRAEALQAYQRARTALAGELGLEPSAELRRLHQAILSADPALDAPAGAACPSPAVATRRQPNQLPLDTGRLVGREQALDEVRRALTEHDRDTPVVALTVGAPGSGKSAFAVHAAHRVRGDYPDGVLFARLQRPDGSVVPSAQVLGDFLCALGLGPGGPGVSLEEMQTAFRNWTARRRLLVVLDDVVETEQINALMPSAGCAVIASSRRLLSHPAVLITTRTAPLEDETSQCMLVDVLGADRVREDSAGLGELVKLSGGLPMTLRAAASLLQLRPHWPIAKLLARARGDVRRIPPATTDAPNITDSVARSFRLLSSKEQTAFRAVAATAEPCVSAAAAAELLGVDEAEAELLLEDLVEFQLAEAEDVDGAGAFRYSIRAPFRTVAPSLTASSC